MQYVIVIGDLLKGILTIHGPFKNKELANQWVSVNIRIDQNPQYHIVRLSEI
jgi:hypothetical protein